MSVKLRLTFLLLFFFEFVGAKDISICSWNLKDFGNSKSEQTLDFVARTLASFDIIAIQEVVASAGGPQAVAKLVAKMNKGAQLWKYEISPVTSGTMTNERYAFIWKSTTIKRRTAAWLDSNYRSVIEREPYMGQFIIGNRSITLVSFHAVPKAKNPAAEIKYLQYFRSCYPNQNLIFCGDFNLPASHTVFNPLKAQNFTAALVKQKTSLRQRCINGDCLASAYDNFYFDASKINVLETGVLHFYQLFTDLKSAKKVSDHLPVYMNIAVN